MQLCNEDGTPVYDWEKESDIAAIEQLERHVLIQIFREMEARFPLHQPVQDTQHATAVKVPKEYVRLTDRESTILEALGDDELIGEHLAKKAGYPFNSAFRTTVSNMKKRGILTVGKGGRGYRRGACQ